MSEVLIQLLIPILISLWISLLHLWIKEELKLLPPIPPTQSPPKGN